MSKKIRCESTSHQKRTDRDLFDWTSGTELDSKHVQAKICSASAAVDMLSPFPNPHFRQLTNFFKFLCILSTRKEPCQ